MDTTYWEAITAISTTGAAVFTAVMAWFTRKAIIDGQSQRQEANDHFAKTREQDQKHHEDAFRPLLTLTPFNPVDAIDRKDIVSCYQHENLGFVFVKCAVNNIGTGPALNIRLHVRSDRRTEFGPSRELVPLAANGTFSDGSGQIEMPVHFNSTFNQADLKNLSHGLWLLVLEYEDVFGNTFHTMHSKHLGEPWTRVGRDSAPDTSSQSAADVMQVNALRVAAAASIAHPLAAR